MPKTRTERCISILRQYAEEESTMVRGTSDISPLEAWLILRIINLEDKNATK